MSTKPKVLYIVHNHSDLRMGGVEVYSQELFEAVRRRDRFVPVLLAKGGAPLSTMPSPHAGTMVCAVNAADDGQYLFFNDGGDYDHFLGTGCSKEHLVVHLDRFLRTIAPDVVHFHHTLFLGYDALRQVRNSLPHAAIIYTLHDFLPICHRNGQLLKTNNRERCLAPSPRHCSTCFPEIAPREFFLRERFIKAQLDHVDLFVAPSRFLRDRYVEWGLPRARVVLEPYGRTPLRNIPDDHAPRERWRFGFFGQLSLFKGVHVLLEAMTILHRLAPGAAHLWVHGNNLDLQPPEFQSRIDRLLNDAAPSVTWAGSYEQSEVRALMANVDWVVVPSIWWENAPLVIQEASLCGRPVICGDVGGMAEAVQPGLTGLHFRTGDAMNLAETMKRAATTPGLWQNLKEQICPPNSADEHADCLERLYRLVMERRHASC